MSVVTALPDGRFRVHVERDLPVEASQAWWALTDPRALSRWFVEILDYDRSRLHFADGAKLTFTARHGFELPDGHGRVVRSEAPSSLEYTWDAETLSWELVPLGFESCRVVFTNTVDDRELAEAVAPAWDTAHERLAAVLTSS